jgi:hypothetical protein
MLFGMAHWLRTLLLSAFFGPHKRGWGFGKRGTCAYCRQERQLVEVSGPIGTGDVLVCRECADACIAIARR